MAALFQFPYVLGIPLLPVQRVIAIDPGSHSLKLVLAEIFRGRVRVMEQKVIDLPAEGLVSPEEIGDFVRNALREMGDYPIAVALPQTIPLSQLIDIGSSGSDSVKQLIEQETLKNRDMHDSPIVYDCLKLSPFGKHQNSFWVTLCKENDVFAQITRLSLVTEDVCEVASSATALVRAYRYTGGGTEPVVLVDFGASSTLVVVVMNGQPAHAASFAIGGNLLTEAVAGQRKCSLEIAESLKRSTNLFAGPEAASALLPTIEGWRNEVEKIVVDWSRDNPEVPTEFACVLCGGNAPQPGLLDHLNRDKKRRFVPWPARTEPKSPGYATVLGTALQALDPDATSSSLMPERVRNHWTRQKLHQRVLSVAFLLLALAGLLLVAGTVQNISRAQHQQEMLETARLALEKAQKTTEVEHEALLAHERIRIVLKRQQQTIDTLRTLSLLDKTRLERNLWYVLLADQLSYFSGRTGPMTNIPPATTAITNTLRRGFVAELCINEDGEMRRRLLSQVVADLKQDPIFSNVDTLPVDRRKNLANPKVLLADRHFALSLELAGDEFQQSLLPPPVITNKGNINVPAPDPRTVSTNRTVTPANANDL